MVSATSKVALITTSTRPKRIGHLVTDFVQPIINEAANSISISRVDVKDFNLPVFDEEAAPAMIPKMASHTTEHAKKWSAEIAKYDGYIIVANEYNFGMSGATKNAIDYLYNEWTGKPILIITYGILGGTNASESLQKTLTGMKLRVMETRPALPFHGGLSGPDMYQTIGGVLPQTSIDDWKAEKTSDILKGFGELQTALREPQPVPPKQ
jgi:NAD(P)H-dependent FMN reductase